MDKLASLQTVRDAGGRFVKGTSGNYRGRPKVNCKIRQLTRVHTEEAILKLVEISTGSNYSSALQFCAGVALLNVGWNTRVMGHFMKGLNMPVWQYLNTPGAHLVGKKENAEQVNSNPSENPSETVKKIVAIRESLNQEYAAKQARRQARLKKQRASISDDELAYAQAWS